MPFAIYLRKSREDIAAEARGEGETLARHEKTLLDLAARLNIEIRPDAIYREIVSGDTIAARPMMQRLLQEVEARLWDGVLTMDIDRLARGETIDQGIMAQAFKYSGTRIITPYKTYDPANDTDETFMEFNLFMARQEYKTIKRRLQAGRLASVKEGHYIGTRMPFGYERLVDKGGKGISLQIVPEKAAMVRQIFAWYLDGVGANTIANRMNAMGITTDLGNSWDGNRIRNLLRNPTYIGMVQWNRRKTVVSVQGGERTKSRPLSDEYICIRGQHDPIIDQETWNQIQAMFGGHRKPPVNATKKTMNPLSSLIRCGICGRTMVRRPYCRGDMLRCTTPNCTIVTTYISIVEDAILDTLKGWTREYGRVVRPPVRDKLIAEAEESTRKQLMDTIKMLNGQMGKLHDLLERNIYSEDVYLQRSSEIAGRIKETETALSSLKSVRAPDDMIRNAIPQTRTVIAAYRRASTIEQKNELLKSVIDHVVYFKDVKCNRGENPAEHVTLTIYPRQIH